MGRIPPEKEWFAIEMEYFPSESLAQKLENRSHHFGNTYERLFNIYEQVLSAVEYLANLPVPGMERAKQAVHAAHSLVANS